MRLLALSALTALIGLAACDTTSSTIPVFGDPYRVERRPAPVLEGDTLRLTVSYTGGCEDHDFELAYSLEGTELWLRHDANEDMCEAAIKESLDIAVDSSRRAPSPLRLYINPAETIALMETDPGEMGTPQ